MKKEIDNKFESYTYIDNKRRLIPRMKWTLKLYLSRWVYQLWSYGCLHKQAVEKQLSKKSRLSGYEIKKFSVYEEEKIKQRIQRLGNNILDCEFDKTVKDLIVSIVKEDDSVKSVVDVGVRSATYLYSIANDYKNINFYGISFAENISKLYSVYEAENVDFYSGYALDFLKESQGFDVVIFDQTATTIQPLEFTEYLNIVKNKTRYLIINEPIYNTWTGKAIDPLGIPIDHPVVAREFSHCLVYNYKKLVEKAGFEVVFYRCRPEDKTLSNRREYGIPVHVLSLIAIASF